jgi:hypothetical protein
MKNFASQERRRPSAVRAEPGNLWPSVARMPFAAQGFEHVETPPALGYCAVMARKATTAPATPAPARAGKPSALLDTRVVYCGLRRAQWSRYNLEQLAKLADSLE